MKTQKHHILIFSLLLSFCMQAQATVYTVSTKSLLQSRMNAAVPGDTVIVANGIYTDWGQIKITNNNGSAASALIVLMAQTFNGVEFQGLTYLAFKGTRIEVNGFKFTNGNAATNPVISFRASSGILSNYCRITNITFDNYNTFSADSSVENEWVALYGTHNRVDHCTFINKYNARATVVVWYDNPSNSYPMKGTSTFHRIDSNFFKGRGYQGANGGETMRIGDSNSSRTDGFNTVEFNLFDSLTQVEPEIISNKSNFNIYRYNTFNNSAGGLTLRHGRYCSVYGNFFIVTDPLVKNDYGVRVIDKGHKIFNNYFEGLNGNKNSLTSLRCPIILYNGLSATTDTLDATKASGYFPADSVTVAFNSIVNCSGGGGLILGFTNNAAYTFQPLGIIVANNVIKMTTGQAAFKPAANTSLTYSAEGNLYEAPAGLGLADPAGFTSAALSYGSRSNGVLTPPAAVQDAAVNSANYSALLNNLDALSINRSAVYDAGAQEINGTGNAITTPLDSFTVGAGKPSTVLPLNVLGFTASLQNNNVLLQWTVNEYSAGIKYSVEKSSGTANNFTSLFVISSNDVMGVKNYSAIDGNPAPGNNYYRLTITDTDGKLKYSRVQYIKTEAKVFVSVYPNPVHNILNIDVASANVADSYATITNSLGVVVKKILLAATHTVIDVQSFARGNYMVALKNKNFKTETIQIVLQ